MSRPRPSRPLPVFLPLEFYFPFIQVPFTSPQDLNFYQRLFSLLPDTSSYKLGIRLIYSVPVIISKLSSFILKLKPRTSDF